MLRLVPRFAGAVNALSRITLRLANVAVSLKTFRSEPVYHSPTRPPQTLRPRGFWLASRTAVAVRASGAAVGDEFAFRDDAGGRAQLFER